MYVNKNSWAYKIASFADNFIYYDLENGLLGRCRYYRTILLGLLIGTIIATVSLVIVFIVANMIAAPILHNMGYEVTRVLIQTAAITWFFAIIAFVIFVGCLLCIAVKDFLLPKIKLPEQSSTQPLAKFVLYIKTRHDKVCPILKPSKSKDDSSKPNTKTDSNSLKPNIHLLIYRPEHQDNDANMTLALVLKSLHYTVNDNMDVIVDVSNTTKTEYDNMTSELTTLKYSFSLIKE